MFIPFSGKKLPEETRLRDHRPAQHLGQFADSPAETV
jgi:hypothetical protein